MPPRPRPRRPRTEGGRGGAEDRHQVPLHDATTAAVPNGGPIRGSALTCLRPSLPVAMEERATLAVEYVDGVERHPGRLGGAATDDATRAGRSAGPVGSLLAGTRLSEGRERRCGRRSSLWRGREDGEEALAPCAVVSADSGRRGRLRATEFRASSQPSKERRKTLSVRTSQINAIRASHRESG